MSRSWALGAGIVGSILVGVYVALFVGEGDNSIAAMAPWASLMLVAAALAFVGAAAKSRRVVRAALLGATIVFGAIGLLAIFTIGILFIAAAVMSGVALAKLPPAEEAPTEVGVPDA